MTFINTFWRNSNYALGAKITKTPFIFYFFLFFCYYLNIFTKLETRSLFRKLILSSSTVLAWKEINNLIYHFFVSVMISLTIFEDGYMLLLLQIKIPYILWLKLNWLTFMVNHSEIHFNKIFWIRCTSFKVRVVFFHIPSPFEWI